MESICKNIKMFRKNRNLTQEELAEKICVSPQAISKWETGAGLPNITQILPLAKTLNITVDRLMGNSDRRAEAEKEWHDTLKAHGDSSKELYILTKQLYQEFPDDYTFNYRMVNLMLFYAEQLESNEQEVILNKSCTIAKTMLDRFPDEKELSLFLIINCLIRSGRKEEASSYACQCQDRDRALKYCLDGDALKHHRQTIIHKKLCSLLHELRWADLPSLNCCEDLIKALFPDENYLGFSFDLMHVALHRAKLYAQKSMSHEAIEELRKATNYADSLPHTEKNYTISLLDTIQSPSYADLSSHVLQSAEALSVYLSGEPEYEILLKKLRKQTTQ